jgi:PAS domain S-box-containing protein
MNHMFKRFTIGTKISISLLVIVLLVIGSDYFIYMAERRSASKSTSSDLMLINDSERRTLEDTLDTAKKRTVDFSSDGYIRDMARDIAVKKDTQMAGALNAHLVKNKLVLDPSLLGINILDNKGVIIASTDPKGIGADESNDVYFPGTEDLPYGSVYMSDFISTVHFTQGAVVLTAAAPLTDRITGIRVGTLMNFFKAEDVVASFKQQAPSSMGISGSYESAHAYLVAKSGFILDPADGSQKIMLSKKANGAIKCGEVVNYRNDAGSAVLGMGMCLDNGWIVVTELNEQETVAQLVTAQWELSGMVAMIIAVILLILYVLNRQVAMPIRSLSMAAKKIGEGYFDMRTNIRSSDEIGDLSREFDEMAKKMQESHDTLAQKVREINKDFEKFKLAVEGASDHVVITDANGTIIYANKVAEETTGYSQSELLGNRPSLWGKQMPQEFYQRMWRTIKEDREPFHGEITNKRKNGDRYIAEVHISPLFDDQQVLYGFVAIERDITKQKEIDRSKTEFVSIASHQLRTPLTIINWYVEMLTTSADWELSKKQLQYLDEIVRASKRMIELVNSLLNVSRIEMGTFMVEPEPVNFADAIEDTLKELIPQITHKKILVVKKLEKDLPPINADPKLLRMIFQNLLANAVTYTPEDGVITVNIERRMENILVTIADTGMGIPSQQQSKIFQKFFRADNAREKEPDGNGLGLYIVKSIVESAGGKIWFTSEENKGTAFYIALPISGMQKKAGTRPLMA